MATLELLIATTGHVFMAAVLAQVVAVTVEQYASSRTADPANAERVNFSGFMLSIFSALGPGLLLLHGFFLTVSRGQPLQTMAVGSVAAAIAAGFVLGRLAGFAAPGGAKAMRAINLFVGIGVFALTLYAASPSLIALADLAQHGAASLPVAPVGASASY